MTINLTVIIVRKITSSLLINQENWTKMTCTPFLYSRMKKIFSAFSVSRFAAVRTFEFFYRRKLLGCRLLGVFHNGQFYVPTF